MWSANLNPAFSLSPSCLMPTLRVHVVIRSTRVMVSVEGLNVVYLSVSVNGDREVARGLVGGSSLKTDAQLPYVFVVDLERQDRTTHAARHAPVVIVEPWLGAEQIP